jgi:hypothetical protein
MSTQQPPLSLHRALSTYRGCYRPQANEYAIPVIPASKLDFVHLRGIANRVHQAVKQDTWNFYHIGLLR